MKLNGKSALLSAALIGAFGLGSTAMAQTYYSRDITVPSIADLLAQAAGDEAPGSAEVDATGPFGGWSIVTSDGVRVGEVISASASADNTRLQSVVFTYGPVSNGHQVQVDGAELTAISNDALLLSIDAATLEREVDAPFTKIDVIY